MPPGQVSSVNVPRKCFWNAQGIILPTKQGRLEFLPFRVSSGGWNGWEAPGQSRRGLEDGFGIAMVCKCVGCTRLWCMTLNADYDSNAVTFDNRGSLGELVGFSLSHIDPDQAHSSCCRDKIL